MINVVVVDDEAAYRDITRSSLAGSSGISIVGEFASSEALLASDLAGFDVLLLDIEMDPGQSGVDALPDIRRRWPSGEVVMLTTFASRDLLFEALRNGASGYLHKGPKTADRLPTKVQQAAAGETVLSPSMAGMMRDFFAGRPEFEQLTRREEEVLELVVEGLTNKQIGERLYIGADGVKYHIKGLTKRLHLANRIQLAVEYTKKQFGHGGLVEPQLAVESSKSVYKSGERIGVTVTLRASGGAGELKMLVVVPAGLSLDQSNVRNGEYEPEAGVWTVPLGRVSTQARLDLRLRGVTGRHVVRVAVAGGSVPAAATLVEAGIAVS